MIIIPDIHGRTFWKEYVKGRENEDIIFLGDYLDPYMYEYRSQYIDVDDIDFIVNDISVKTIENFKEIIEFKKAHMDNVTLLLGNHDFGGYINDEMPRCRYDYDHAAEIKQIFRENLSLFSLIVFRNINDKTVSFSHSFIGSRWMNYPPALKGMNIKDVASTLNNAVKNNNQELLTDCLYFVGRARGGSGWVGSVVWSDVCEADYIANYPDDIDFQIFGHSQQEYMPIISDDYACLDVRQGFTLTPDGVLICENLNIEKCIIFANNE